MKNERTELQNLCQHIADELKAIYNGQAVNDDGEEATFWDYLADALDVEYTIGSDKSYRGARIAVTLGGPNIYINTRRGEVEGFWGTERAEAWIPSEICEELDGIMEEYYTCS